MEDSCFSKETFYKKETNKIIDDVEWELFDIDSYVKSLNFPENDLIFLLGTSGEGKSVCATQFVLKILEKNIKNNLKTSLWVLSQTDDSKKMVLNCAQILNNLFPNLKSTWNNDSICSIAHTKDIKNIINDFNLLQSKNEHEIQNNQFIFYFDDVGTILSSTKNMHRGFFDTLSSQGRHYNIITIINSQKLFGLSKVLVSQIGTCILVGKITSNDWDYLMKSATFHSMSKRTQQEFYNKYFTQIGIKGSRNILIFQKKEQKKVYLHKCSEKFVDLVKKQTF